MATLTELQHDSLTLIRVAGGLTFDGVGPISRRFEELTSGGRVIVDLSGVPMMTTPGISLLLSALKRMQHHGGQLVLAALSPHVRDVLRRCRLDCVFTIVDDEAAGQRVLLEGVQAKPA